MASGSQRGWLGKKKQEEEASRQQAVAQRRQRARQQLIKRVESLVEDPRFQVLTFDKMNWINPYTGQIVSVPFDTEKGIRDYLLQHQPWQSGKEPLPLLKMTQIVWIHYLMRNMTSDEMLHIFKGDNWLNPFTGQWISDVPLDPLGKPDGKTVTYLSKVLNGDPRCAALKMINRHKLDILAAGMPNQSQIEDEEHIDVYDGLIEDDESLYLDFNLMEKDTETYTPLSNPLMSQVSRKNDEHTRLIQRINAANKRIPEAPVAPVARGPSSSSQQLRSVFLPELPNLKMATKRIHGREQYNDFTYAVTMGTGQTLLIHGNLLLPETEQHAPYRDLESIIRKVAQVESDLNSICRVLHQQLGQHFQYMLGLDCFALIIDTLDMHVELAIAGFDRAIAARPAEQSLLNLIGESCATLGMSDEGPGELDTQSLPLEGDDILLFYTHGLVNGGRSHASLCAAFVSTMVADQHQELEALLESLRLQLENTAHSGGTLFALKVLEIHDDLSLI